MKNYIIYDTAGKILRTGVCVDPNKQVHQGEFVMEGKANDVAQKIINGQIVDKTFEEIERDNPAPPEKSSGK